MTDNIDRIYNTRLLQTRNVGILERKGFEIVSEDSENHDIRLSKNGADCIVDAEGNIRWTDAKTDDSRTDTDK